MKVNTIHRTVMSLAAVCAIGLTVALPVVAQDSKMSDSKMSGSKMSSASTKASKDAKIMKCQHCKMTFTAAEAKAHKNKCCGLPLVKIKASKKSTPAKG